MPPNSLIVGVDLAPIKSIPRCITFQSDITTDKCRATLRQHLKSWKADTVLHDGAPNVGTAWVQDAFSQAELVLQSLRLATDFLIEGGTFVTKIFRSKDYNSLLWVFNQLFTKVEATKPPSSRNVSAEIFVVCRGYKAPKRLDPRFLDPKSVFAELSDPTPNNEAKVFNPEKKKRKRDGYEEGNWTQYKEAPASDFIQSTDPIAILATLNKLTFNPQLEKDDVVLAAINRFPETTQEIRDCCADLKVLGKGDFRRLLSWRLKLRDKFEISTKKTKVPNESHADEVVEIESMDDEFKLEEELQRLNDKEDSRKKKEKRRENERKQREIKRMQMHMTTPMDIGTEQTGPRGDDSMFALKGIERANGLGKVAKGRMELLLPEKKLHESFGGSEDEESDPEADNLEGELDSMYERYQERKSDTDAKYRAKKARKEFEDSEEWHGFSDEEASGDDGDIVDEGSESNFSEDDEDGPSRLLTDLSLQQDPEHGLTRRAALFFDQEIFRSIDESADQDRDSGIDVESGGKSSKSDYSPQKDERSRIESDEDAGSVSKNQSSKARSKEDSSITADQDMSSESELGFEAITRTESEWEKEDEPMKDGRPDIDIITAEAMTLAQQLVTGQKTRHDLLDDNFNKYALRDVDGLPDWFLDDESRHSKPQRPITAAAAAAIKEKLRALNARPIKKVREAKDRKKFKAAQKFEKLRKKSATLLDEEGMSEKEKAQGVAKLMAKAAKKKPKKQVKLVVARGGNRGISGRPKGTKGKYKMVDARLKKDVRAEKRLAKKKK